MSVDTTPAPAITESSNAVNTESTSAPPAAVAESNVAAGDAAGAPAADSQQQQLSSSSSSANTGAQQFTLRALVSSKEAGVIIGKAGKNVADLREATGVKAGVSKVVPGVPERVLSVTGTLEGVIKVSWGGIVSL